MGLRGNEKSKGGPWHCHSTKLPPPQKHKTKKKQTHQKQFGAQATGGRTKGGKKKKLRTLVGGKKKSKGRSNDIR